MDNSTPFYAELMDLKSKRQTVQTEIAKFVADVAIFRNAIDDGRAEYRRAIERGNQKTMDSALGSVKYSTECLEKAAADFETKFRPMLAAYKADADKLILAIRARNDEISEIVKGLAALSKESESNRQQIPSIQGGIEELRLAIDAGLTSIRAV